MILPTKTVILGPFGIGLREINGLSCGITVKPGVKTGGVGNNAGGAPIIGFAVSNGCRIGGADIELIPGGTVTPNGVGGMSGTVKQEANPLLNVYKYENQTKLTKWNWKATNHRWCCKTIEDSTVW